MSDGVATQPTNVSAPRTWRQGTALPVVAAVALVLARSFAPTWYEGYHFDSDQAVVGLMAKHLSELRAFPLFVYGQHYILGIQSWLAAPFFLAGGPTVAMLRLPLVLINCGIAAILVSTLVRETKLRPWLAFVAALPFTMPTPMTASHLVEALGYSVEPILYVLLLWLLRRRAVLFGVVLIVGYLHREFTAYALPALVLVMAIERSLFTRQTFERAAVVAAVCAVGWVLVEVVKRHVDVLGPSTGTVENAPLAVQLNVIAGHVCAEPQAVLGRLRSLWSDCLTGLFGAKRFYLWEYQVSVDARTGSPFIAWALAAAGLVMLVRLPIALRNRRAAAAGPAREGERVPTDAARAEPRTFLFCLYLAAVGLQSALAYPLACDVMPGFPGIIRYVLLVLLVPVAVAAAYFRFESSPRPKAFVAAVLVGWAAFNAVDNARAVRSYATNPPPNHRRLLADYLRRSGIKYSRADYWDAYITDFYARERVTVATTWKVRVREYEQRVDAHRAEAATIVRGTCRGGEGVIFDAWCIRRARAPGAP